MWEQWRPSLQLETGFVHVIVWPLAGASVATQVPEDDTSCLSPDERARASRFVFDRHRIAYVQAHVGMRRVLASYCECSPGALRFITSSRGKPELTGLTRRLPFNLSHTEGLCALAVGGPEDEVGVDVERVRPIEALVARSHFSPSEQAQLGRLEGDAWTAGFFRCWTRKEALLKAEGFGLHVPLDSFDVSLLPGEPAALMAHRPEARLSRSWRLYHFDPEEGVAGALAVSSNAEPLFLRMGSIGT